MSLLRNCWYVAAWADEVSMQPLARRILDLPMVLFRTASGRAVAMLDRCPHRLLPLSKGSVVGEHIECGYHGLAFDSVGQCVRAPAQPRIPPEASVQIFAVVEHWGMLWVWPGAPALAATSALFDQLPWGQPGWTLNTGPYTHVNADYRLLIENLLDPVHVTYVHKSTLGTAAMAEIPITTQQLGDTILVTRWTRDQPAAPILQRYGKWPGHVDRWQYYWWYPASIAVVDFGAHPPGTGESEEARQSGIRMYSNHFLTPETEQSTHYFWCQLRNFAAGDAAVSQDITEQFIMAFEEDKAVLEAIEIARREPLIHKPVKLALDAGSVRMHRTLDRLIEIERSAQ